MEAQLQLEAKRNRVLLITLAGLLFVSPLLYVGALRDPSDLPRYAALALCLCLLMIIFVFYLYMGVRQIYATVALYIALIYFVYAGISGLWAVQSSTNLVYTIRLLCYVGLFFIAVQISSKRSIKILLGLSLVSAGLSALIGLLQNHGLNFLHLRGYAMGGTFTYKNHMTLYLDLVIPAGLMLLLTTRTRWQQLCFALSLALCIIYIFNSHTRGSYLAQTVAILLAVTGYVLLSDLRKTINQHVKQRGWVLVLLLIVVASVSMLPGKADRYLDRPTYAGDKMDTSSRDRLTAYHNALSLIKEHPLLGSGYGTFWKAFRPFTNHPNVIKRSDEQIVLYRMHNDFLQIVVELGLIGGALCLSVIGFTYFYGIRQLRAGSDGTENLLLFGLILSLSATLTHSLVDFPLLKPSSAEQFWVYLGLISGLYAHGRSLTVDIRQAWIKLSSTLAVIVLTVSLTLYYRAYLLGSYYAREAIDSYSNKQCGNALHYIDASINTFNHDFYVHKLRVILQIDCNRNIPALFDILGQELAWDNTDVQALLKRGYILLGSHWLKEADRDFQAVVYLLPHRASGYIGEAYVLNAMGKHEEADKLLHLLQSRFPGNPDVKKLEQKINEPEKKHQ